MRCSSAGDMDSVLQYGVFLDVIAGDWATGDVGLDNGVL
jgi:hypothetical protein